MSLPESSPIYHPVYPATGGFPFDLWINALGNGGATHVSRVLESGWPPRQSLHLLKSKKYDITADIEFEGRGMT